MMKSPTYFYAIFSALAGFLGVSNSTAQSAYPDPVFTSYFRQETGWQAGDGTISVPLPGGQVLWLFGDSYVDMAYMAADTSLPCLFNRRNALVIQNDANPSVLTYYTSLIPPTAGHYYWPGKGVYHDGKVYIFLLERNSGGFVGSRCAELSFPGLQVLNIHNVPNPEGIEFGKATFVDETNGWLYVYGSRLFPGFGVHRYYASRCPLSNLLQGWQYWSGSAWAAQPNLNAHLLTPAVGCPSFTIFPHEGKYYLLSQDNGSLICGMGQSINLYRADTPQGAFNHYDLVYIVGDTYDGIPLATYNAQAHYGLAGDLLVSYNLNDVNQAGSGCPRQCNAAPRFNADTYRPKFVRLPWSVLPVTWLYVEVEAASGGALVKWATASEAGNSHFEVERSQDGKIFELIGSLAGAGHSDQARYYQMMDDSPFSGLSYYRLRQVDWDGASAYSSTEAFQHQCSASLSARLYPNPLSHSSLQLELQSSKCSNLGLALYNLNGEQLWRRHFEGVVSGELLPLNIGKDLRPGIYTVQLWCADEQLVLRLVVQ